MLYFCIGDVMLERIKLNEERLDRLVSVFNSLSNVLESVEKMKEDLYLLNDYYGSKEWFSDKSDLESGKVHNIKAGVLSEDAVWDLLVDVKTLCNRMVNVSNEILCKETK